MAEKKKFNLAELISEKEVSNLDTVNAPQIRMIDLDNIVPNEANFYELSNIKPLADSIALDGLQQPLGVTPIADESGKFKLISGHRRRAAIESLVNDPKEPREDLRKIPCLVREYASGAMAELQLILANSTSRVLTPAEVSRQAERVEMLLYELKESGVEFPGRMRDHVAEACNVSASKLARLKVIRENLCSEALEAFDSGDLAESSAYVLAQRPADTQVAVVKMCPSLKNVPEWRLKEKSELYEGIQSFECKKAKEPCMNKENRLAAATKDANMYAYVGCRHNQCCADCQKMLNCPQACEKLKDKIKKQKQKDKDQLQKEKNEAETRRLNMLAERNTIWLRVGFAMNRAGFDAKKFHDTLYDLHVYSLPDTSGLKKCTEGNCDNVPYGADILSYSAKTLKLLAETLDCSIDYILGLSNEPALNKEGTHEND